MPIPNILTNLNALVKQLTPGKMITLFGLAAGTIAGFVFLIIWTGRADYQILYANLAQEDAGAIVAKLKEKQIEYQIASNGRSILIPGSRLYETRMELASEGLPRGSGVGFEIFDNTKLGMTEFVQNVNYQRALQGELARTINQFSEVESSRVHIVMVTESLFMEKEKPATASVVVKLRPGRWLGKDQVQGIVHLVSSSVSGLKPENVTVVDSYGKMLAGLEGKSRIGKIRSEQLEFKEKLEKRLENSVKTMLEKALGPAKAIVRLSCSIDFKRSEKTEERYYPDNKVVRSEQLLSETSKSPAPVSAVSPKAAANAAAIEKRVGKANENPGYQKQDRTVNYEIGKVTSHIVEPVGKIKRISVAVLVDGTYKIIKVKKRKTELEYLPRTREEMEKLESIIKRAVNFDPERGDKVEVANIPFATTKLAEEKEGAASESWLSDLKGYAPVIVKYIIAGFFFFFTFLFVVRPLIQWLTSDSGGDVEILQQLPKTVGEIESEHGREKKSLPFMDKASQMIRRDKNSSVELMKGWLKES